MRTWLGIGGVVMLLVSIFFVAAAVGDILRGGDGKTPMGVLWGLLLFFSGLSFVGGVMIRKGFWAASGPPPVSQFEQEQRILALAEHEGGRLTISQVALHCHISVANSKLMLDHLASQGVAQMHFDDNGDFYYNFKGLVSNAPNNNQHSNSQTNQSTNPSTNQQAQQEFNPQANRGSNRIAE